MNKATETFRSFLDVIEFELVFYGEEGWGLIDLQGANLGDIEGERFQTGAEIIDRLDVYIRDYYLEDLESEAGDYGLYEAVRECERESGIKGIDEKNWLNFREKFKGDPEVEKFVADYKHEFDVLDMIVNHAGEVNLDEITAANA